MLHVFAEGSGINIHHKSRTVTTRKFAISLQKLEISGNRAPQLNRHSAHVTQAAATIEL